MKMILGLEWGYLKEFGEGMRKVWVDFVWMILLVELLVVGFEMWVVFFEVLLCGGGKVVFWLRDSYFRY